MIIINIIVGIATLGIGLLVTWPIQLIWTIIAVNMHNSSVKNSANKSINSSVTESKEPQNLSAKSEETIVRPTSPSSLFNYSAAAALSDPEIANLLSESKEDLNPEYVKTLEHVAAERQREAEVNQARIKAYGKVLFLSAEEIDERIANAEIYNDLVVDAAKYIKRCTECSIESTEEGFIATYKEGYVAPETPTEQAARLAAEEQVKLRRAKAKQREEEEARNKKQNTMIALVVIVLVIVGLIARAFVSSREAYYENMSDKAATYILEGQSKHYLDCMSENSALAIYDMLLEKLPYFKTEEFRTVVEFQIARTQQQKDEKLQKKEEYEQAVATGLYRVGDIYDVGGVKGVIYKVNGKHGAIIEDKVASKIKARDAVKKGKLPTEKDARLILKNKDILSASFEYLTHQTLFGKAFWIDRPRNYKNFYDPFIRVGDASIGDMFYENIYDNNVTSALWVKTY
ncbi:MAG: hypothetical protein SNH94_01940 [Rikenellaceae bacterium]